VLGIAAGRAVRPDCTLLWMQDRAGQDRQDRLAVKSLRVHYLRSFHRNMSGKLW